MATYYVEVKINQLSDMYARTRFTSRATTAKGITMAASKALRDSGYRTFEEPTTRDIGAVIGGHLVFISDYQKHGLFK